VSPVRTVIFVGRCELCVALTLPIAGYFGYQGPGKPNWIIEHPAYMLLWSVGLFSFGVTILRYNRASVKLSLASHRWQQKKAPSFLQPLFNRRSGTSPSFTFQRRAVIFGSTALTLVGAAGVVLCLRALAHML
jgi:hypothetical protein